MDKRSVNQNLVGRFSKRNVADSFGVRAPFWFSASNYYVLATAISIAAFFLTWGFLNENKDEISWITAGIISSLILIGAVALRGILLRRAQSRFLFEQKQIDFNLRVAQRNQSELNPNKLTLEKNAIILEEIEKKSKAARVLEKLPEGHLEVFELCEEYLKKNESELNSAGVGSPRLPVLRKSREKVEKFHKYHLLTWASLESRLLIQDAKIQPEIGEKLAYSQRALNVLDSAVQFYPNELLLTDSINAVKEFVVTVRVSHWMEQAERAAHRENYKRAVSHYRDALFFLARENERTPEKDLMAEKINAEIQKLSESTKNVKIKDERKPL